MKRLVIAAILMALAIPGPFCFARDANSDGLRLQAKANQTQHQKDAAQLKAIEDAAAKSVKGLTGQVTHVPQM